jgi:predicted ArsR family transcriptional regulator
MWLAAAVPSPAAAREAGRALGAAAAGEAAVAADAGTDPLLALFDLLTTEGFSPELDERSGPEAILLHRCPFADVAAAAPAKVCALHDGLVVGFCAAAGGPDAHVAPAGPGSGGCAVRWT